MFNLANDTLEVQLLDPIVDRARFGVRYCTGGYIFQVHQLQIGPKFPDRIYCIVSAGGHLPDIQRGAHGFRPPLKRSQNIFRAFVREFGLEIVIMNAEGQPRAGASFIDLLQQRFAGGIAGDVGRAE